MASALIVDFGGVLTTNVFESFRSFAEAEGIAPDAVRSLFEVRMAMEVGKGEQR